ncbi:MAG: hypothetical protein KGZ69_12430 [Methylomonas sp.]|nr:hypothetical protein [Methylomonas sp.]
MENLISKHDLINASAIKGAVGPAADALKKIDTESLGLSVNETKILSQAAKILSDLDDFAQSVIDLGNKQFQSRDVELINRASSRFFAVDRDIAEAKAHQYHAEQAFIAKTAELQKQGFSAAEIKKLVTDPKPEIEALQQKINGLIVEKSRIEAFLADSPRFSPDLLIGTAIEVFADETAQAA